MSILRADGRLYLKGAVEVVLPLCAADGASARAANEDMASRGLRVLAMAVGEGPQEADLRLLGLLGLADPPRTEAVDAVEAARSAGIRTVMITGDHPMTALAIAREMGIVRAGDDPGQLVHARATPQEKIETVRTWKSRGEVVAMTGDGVNDAPALKEAHVGIAMGRTGTEVTREASDMILTDDNFASIVAAIKEGRGIYENIQKTLVYLLAGNAGELAIMLGASLAGLPLPLLPLQLLWINLVTDGLPALALVMDPPDPNVLRRPPRSPSEPMLGRAQWLAIAMTGLLDAAVALGAFAWALTNRDLAEARSLAFSVLVFTELLRAFAARSRTLVFWEVGPLSNLKLLGVVFGTALIQLLLHHVPAAGALLSAFPLSIEDCLLSVALGLIPVSILETHKLVRRWLMRGATA
jgi:Ca2+-transporting ATPase